MKHTKYELKKVLNCLKRIFSCATSHGNILKFVAFLSVVPLFIWAENIEIDNISYQVNVFRGVNGASMRVLCFRTIKGLLLKLFAAVVSDLAIADFFYTALEQSLSDYLSLGWKDFHKFTQGELLTMQYEKGQSVTKFMFELSVTIVINLYKITKLIQLVARDTHSFVGVGFLIATAIHILMFCLFFKTYNLLQMKYLDSKTKARSLVESESKNFSVIKAYDLAEVSTGRVEVGMENRRIRKMKLAAYDARSGLIYKFFEIFSIIFLYSFYFGGVIKQQFLNSITKQVIMLYEGIRDLLTAMGALRAEFHTFYTLEEHAVVDEFEKIKIIEEFEELNCENISFNDIFANISIKIKKNQKIALVGRNGSGKTSLLRCLAGHLKSDGLITINSVDMAVANKKDIHKLITFISQNDTYTHGSVMKNIQYGNTLSKEQVIEKCKIFGVDSVFRELDGGYDKCSNSLGLELSGGQRQRIGFMRGVLRDTPLLIVDDCLNGVNTSDRQFLLKTLQSIEKRAIVMTVDSYESLIKFDQIIYLNGSNTKVGSFKDLQGDLKVFFNK